MLLRQFLCVGLAILLTSLGTVSSSHLSIISDELYILSRVVTEIDLSNEELVPSFEVRRRLYGFPPEEAVHRMKKDNVDKLPQLLQSIVNEAEKVCSGQPNSAIRLDTQADMTVIENGIKFFESIDKSKVADISEALVGMNDAAHVIIKFNSIYSEIFASSIENNWGKVFDDYMKKTFTTTDTKTVLFDLIDSSDSQNEGFIKLGPSVNAVKKISPDDFKRNMSIIEKIENLTPVNQATTVNALTTELDKLLPKFKKLGEVLSYESVTKVFGYIDRMNTAFIPSKMTQKNMSIDTVFSKFEDLFLKQKNIPWNVNSISDIANMTTRVTAVRKNHADERERLDLVKIGRGVLHISQAIQEDIKKAQDAMGPFLALRKLSSCSNLIRFDAKFEKSNFSNPDEVDKYFKSVAMLSEAMNRTVGPPFKDTPLLHEFREIQNADDCSVPLMDFKKHAAQFKLDLMAYESQHKPYQFSNLSPYPDLKIFVKTSTGFLINQALKADCVDEHKDLLKEARNAKTASVTCPRFLSPSDENWKKFIAAATRMAHFIDPNITPNPANPTRKRRSNNMSLLSGVSADLEGGVEVLMRLAEVFEKRDSIRKLMAVESQIDAEVAKLTDAEQKTAIRTVWNTATKNSLRALPEDIQKLDDKLDVSPGNISEFDTVFRATQSFDFPAVDTQKLIHVLKVINLPADVQKTLDEAGELDLDFASSRQRLASAAATLQTVEKFFTDLFFVPPPVQPQNPGNASPNSPQGSPETTITDNSSENEIDEETDRKTSESSSISIISLILICGAILLIAVSLGGLAYWKRADLKDMFKGQKNEKTEAKSSKNTKSRSVDSEEKAIGSKEV